MFFICFWHFFPFLCPRVNRFQCLFAQLLFFKERHEQFNFVPLFKRATISYLLTSLFRKEGKCNLLLCSQKTSNSLEIPMSKCPTLCNPCFLPCCANILPSASCYTVYIMCILLYVVYLLPAESEWEILVVFILQIDICLQSRSLPPLPAIHFS